MLDALTRRPGDGPTAARPVAAIDMVAIGRVVSRLLVRLINTGPRKILRRIAVPRNSPLLQTATASQGGYGIC